MYTEAEKMQTWQREWGNMGDPWEDKKEAKLKERLVSAIFLLADEISQLRAELKSTNKKDLLAKERKGWKEKADLLVAQMNDRKQRGTANG